MRHRFDGFDYSELYEKWGMDFSETHPDLDDGSLFECFVNNYIGPNVGFEGANRVALAFIKDARAFLVACSEWGTYESAVWKALAEVEDDSAFIRLFIPLIPYMWN